MLKKLEIIIFVGILTIFGIVTLVDKEEISFSERKELADFPSLIENGSLNDEFFDDFEDFISDHFLLRDDLRKLKALFTNNILMMSDNNGIYFYDDMIFEMEETINENSINYLANLIKELNSSIFYDQDTYIALIPRKNDFIINNKHPEYKYEDMLSLLEETLAKEVIDLKSVLSLDSYYATDIHWRQEKIADVAKKLLNEMGEEYIELDFKENSYAPFYGALYGKAATNLDGETIIYLDSDYFDNVEVYNYEKDSITSVYDKNALSSIDAYSVFLDGPTAYLKISNQNATNDDKLIVIRDSYSSSLLPLMIASYSEIHVVDLRYYSSQFLNDLNLPKDASVIYILGSEVANNSFSLK